MVASEVRDAPVGGGGGDDATIGAAADARHPARVTGEAENLAAAASSRLGIARGAGRSPQVVGMYPLVVGLCDRQSVDFNQSSCVRRTPVMIKDESAEKESARTTSAWAASGSQKCRSEWPERSTPGKDCTSWPVSASKTLTCPESVPIAHKLPSGL
jgi:hypothetical protein